MDPAGKSRGGRPRGFDRNKALQTAMGLFWKRGYEGVSISDLTVAMGVAPPSLYAAFGSKARLYEEALTLYGARQAAHAVDLGTHRPIRDILHDVLRAAVEAVTDPAGVAGCMVSNGMLFHAPENAAMAERTAALRQVWREALQERLRRAEDAGEIAPSPGAETLARYLAALMQGLSVQARDGATRKELMAVAELGLLHAT